MKKSKQTEHHTSQIARKVLRYGAIIAPISMLIYVMLVRASIIEPAHTDMPPSLLAILTITVAWVALGSFTFFTKQSVSRLVNMVEIVLYYILAALQTWFISGMVTPFASYLVLLLIATYAIFGKNGLALGVAFFGVILIVDTALLEPGNINWAIYSLLTMLAVIISALVIAGIYAGQQTSHRELERSKSREATERERAQTLINNFTDAVFSIDQKGSIKTYNAAALNILDTNDKIDGKKISDLLKIETAEEEPIDVFKELSKDTSIRKRDDLVMRIDEDDMLRLEVTFAPIQSAGSKIRYADSYVLIVRDITRMKSLEEERDEFISVVSHELRTPITIAEGSLDNAEIFAKRGSDKMSRQAIAEAHKQVLYLAKMINDLSTLSRAERGISSEVEVIDTRELAHNLHITYSPQAEEKSLALNLDLIGNPSKVSVSRLYLEELLQNFITNAIKYTETGSVTIRLKNTKEGTVRFSVSDTGIGIRKADLDKIFKRFYRAEDYRTRETSGTGLGLYVSSKLARKLGCKIEVESRINHGSTFSFELPKVEN